MSDESSKKNFGNTLEDAVLVQRLLYALDCLGCSGSSKPPGLVFNSAPAEELFKIKKYYSMKGGNTMETVGFNMVFYCLAEKFKKSKKKVDVNSFYNFLHLNKGLLPLWLRTHIRVDYDRLRENLEYSTQQYSTDPRHGKIARFEIAIEALKLKRNSITRRRKSWLKNCQKAGVNQSSLNTFFNKAID